MSGPPCLNIVALLCCMQSGRVMPSALFFVLWIALAILGHVCFHVNFMIIGSISVKNVLGNLIGIA